MKEMVFRFDTEARIEEVREYFIRTCGLDFEKEKHRRMMKQAEDVLARGGEGVALRCVTREFTGNLFSGECLNLEGVEFRCNAFDLINPVEVLSVWPYILTAGEVATNDEEDSIMDKLFADIWGTSFVDVARDLLREKILQRVSEQYSHKKNVVLSDSFGPGFFGMDITLMGKFFDVLSGDHIGVSVRESSLLLPLKSCAGFFVAVEGQWNLPSGDCLNCRGNTGGCRFCQNYRDKKGNTA